MCRSIGKNQCHHVYFPGCKYDIRSRQLHRRILAAYGRGGRCLSLFNLAHIVRRCRYIFCFSKQNSVRFRLNDVLCADGGLLKKIMRVALPNGVENGVQQLVKVALSSMVALFGTYQIAANGVAQSIWSLASIMGLAKALLNAVDTMYPNETKEL